MFWRNCKFFAIMMITAIYCNYSLKILKIDRPYFSKLFKGRIMKDLELVTLKVCLKRLKMLKLKEITYE